MKLLFLPRNDRPYDEKVAGLTAAGFEVTVYKAEPTERGGITQRFVNHIKGFDLILLEFAVVAGNTQPGCYLSWGWVRKNFPNKRIVLWCEEIRRAGDYFPQFQDVVPYFSDVFINHADTHAHADWRSMGIKGKVGSMWGSAEVEIADSTGNVPIKYDVVFAGKFHISRSRTAAGAAFPLSDRRMTVLRLIDKHFNLGIAGEGWGGFKNVVGRINDRREVYRFLKSGRIVFGMNQFDLFRYYPERFWQALSTGRASLTHRIRGMEQDFTPGVHLETFGNADEVIGKIKGLLANNRCDDIGRAGRKALDEGHSWYHHYRHLFNELKPLTPHGAAAV